MYDPKSLYLTYTKELGNDHTLQFSTFGSAESQTDIFKWPKRPFVIIDHQILSALTLKQLGVVPSSLYQFSDSRKRFITVMRLQPLTLNVYSMLESKIDTTSMTLLEEKKLVAEVNSLQHLKKLVK